MSRFSTFLISFICFGNVLTNANAEQIPVVQVRYQILIESNQSDFFTLVKSQCPYVELIVDDSASNKLILGSFKFVSEHEPDYATSQERDYADLQKKNPFGKQEGYYAAALEKQRTGLHSIHHGKYGSESGKQHYFELTAKKFANELCLQNEKLKELFDKKLPPIIVKPDSETFGECTKNKLNPLCDRQPAYNYLILELSEMFGSSASHWDRSQVLHKTTYELKVKFIDEDTNNAKTQLILSRYNDGRYLGDRVMDFEFRYGASNTLSISLQPADKKVALMNWLLEQTQQQEWK